MTALEELTKWWNEEFPDWDKSSEGYRIIEKAIELMDKEKQQIIDSFERGVFDKEHGNQYKNGQEYFIDNYE